MWHAPSHTHHTVSWHTHTHPRRRVRGIHTHPLRGVVDVTPTIHTHRSVACVAVHTGAMRCIHTHPLLCTTIHRESASGEVCGQSCGRAFGQSFWSVDRIGPADMFGQSAAVWQWGLPRSPFSPPQYSCGRLVDQDEKACGERGASFPHTCGSGGARGAELGNCRGFVVACLVIVVVKNVEGCVGSPCVEQSTRSGV